MGTRYLIDTNIIIYFFKDEIPVHSAPQVEDILRKSFNISVITRIEYLGYRGFTASEFGEAQQFLDQAKMIMLNDAIIEKTIDLKRRRAIKTPDAIIAATCLVQKLTLVTRNADDFSAIKGLRIYNPFQPPE